MSIRRAFHKFHHRLHQDSLSWVLLASAAVGLGGGAGWDVGNKDRSDLRAPSGEVQYRLLDEKMKSLASLEAARHGQEASFDVLRQAAVLEPSNAKAAADYAALKPRYEGLAKDVDEGSSNFRRALLLSRGISEEDALEFDKRYEKAFGEGVFGERAQIAYLDECQALTSPRDDSSGEASSVAECVSQKVYSSFPAGIVSIVGAVGGGIAALFFLTAGAGARRRLEEEEDRLRSRRAGKEAARANKTKTEEVSLKVKITKPE